MTAPVDFIAPSVLEDNDYLHRRLDPQLGDPLYLHLSDLRLAMDHYGPYNEDRVLDYGCGGSPYRSLFRAKTYHRADIAGTPTLDFPFGPDSRISAPSDSYDLILSTQVLEHVRDVTTYLAEVTRLLRPGGRLIISTHGVFHDHGCPYDFRRWTADGLRNELQTAGLEVSRISKLTTRARALALLNQHYHSQMKPNERSPLSWAWQMSWLLYGKTRRRLNSFLDREYRNCRVVSAEDPGHDFYIALIAEAKRRA